MNALALWNLRSAPRSRCGRCLIRRFPSSVAIRSWLRLTTTLLAETLDADALLIPTDVANMFTDFDTSEQKAIGVRHHSSCARAISRGSMGPKLRRRAASLNTGARAGIGRLEDVQAILLGTAGT